MPLKPQHEAFCQAYAAEPNGAEAARAAGYADSNARHQAFILLQRPDILERLRELGADIAETRDTQAAALVAALDPVYQANLRDGRYDRVLQVVELQARIAGVLRGGSTVRPNPDGALEERIRKMVFDSYTRTRNAEEFQRARPLPEDWTDEDEEEYDRRYLNRERASDDDAADEDDDEA